MKQRMTKGKKTGLAAAAAVLAVCLLAAAGLMLHAAAPAQAGDGALVIPLSQISGTAAFFPVEVDGTAMEVIAVRDSAGKVRTAFNTCQICYGSGRGYSPVQRDQVHPGGRAPAHHRRGRAAGRPHPGRGQRRRDLAGGSALDLRAVLPRRPLPKPQERRHGHRPGNRAGHRGGARRPGVGAQRAGARLMLYRRAAAPRRGPARELIIVYLQNRLIGIQYRYQSMKGAVVVAKRMKMWMHVLFPCARRCPM